MTKLERKPEARIAKQMESLALQIFGFVIPFVIRHLRFVIFFFVKSAGFVADECSRLYRTAPPKHET
jgi:hypothetical protein